MHDDTIWIEVPSMLVVAPNGRLKFAMPCLTSPESTAREMVTGNVAALLELANAKVNAVESARARQMVPGALLHAGAKQVSA